MERYGCEYSIIAILDRDTILDGEKHSALMAWTIETLGAVVDREIKALPHDIQAAFLRLAERIETVGLEQIGHPHVKHLRGKLWEMRLSGKDGIGRAIYVTQVGQRLVVVHAFVKKSQKTPRTALYLAERRAKEIER